MSDRAATRSASPATLALAIIVVVAVLLRVAAAFYLGNSVEVLPGTFDQISYHTLALRVLDGHGFSFATLWWPMTPAGEPTAHWSFLYTLYLTAVYAVFGPNPLAARLIQAVIGGIILPVLAYLLGRQVFGERTGLLAAAFTAIYIYFVYYAATLMTETFFIAGVMTTLYLLLRLAAPPPHETRLAMALGLVMGATILLRQLFLLLVPFLLAWLWLARYVAARRGAAQGAAGGSAAGVTRFLRGGHAPLASTAIVVGLIVLMILPFSLYNTSRFGRFVLLNTNAGYAFFWANHPVYGTKFEGILPAELGTYQDLVPPELRQLDEAALEQALMARGLQFVVDDPGRYILLSLSRLPIYFMFWPSAESGMVSNISRVGSFALFLPLMLAGLIYSLAKGAVRRRTLGQASLLMLFMVLYTGIHLASWALIRYRLPVDAILLVYAGLAADAIWTWFAQRKASAAQPGVA